MLILFVGTGKYRGLPAQTNAPWYTKIKPQEAMAVRY